MNASRFFASHLRSSEVQKDNRTLAVCYRSLAVLSDYLLDIHSYYPRWCEFAIIDTLSAASRQLT